jgi:hypothetical protein
LEAAERRMRETESRGVKDVESVRRQQQKKQLTENLEMRQPRGVENENNLRVKFDKIEII